MLSKADELFAAQQHKWGEEGFVEEARKRLGDATLTQLIMAKEDIAIYEKLRAGQIEESFDIVRLPRMLTCLRIASGLSQSNLADKLALEFELRDVRKNERNEYHGINSLKAQKVLDVLPVSVSVVAEDLQTQEELGCSVVKGLGNFLLSLRKSKEISYDQLADRLREEIELSKQKPQQDYMDCAMAQVNVDNLIGVLKVREEQEIDGVVTMTTAAIVAKALKVKLTVKDKLTT